MIGSGNNCSGFPTFQCGKIKRMWAVEGGAWKWEPIEVVPAIDVCTYLPDEKHAAMLCRCTYVYSVYAL